MSDWLIEIELSTAADRLLVAFTITTEGFQPMMSIRRATTHEAPALAALIASAFVDDPIQAWTFAGSRLEPRLQRFFTAYARPVAARGWLWTVEDHAGVAMWAPPGSAEALAEVDAVADPVAREISGDEGVRYHALWDWVESHRPGESHWYLDVLAVAAGRRGRGLGGALVRHGLTMAANERVPAFLVTSRASTAAFYARNGFAIIQQGFPPAGGPELWFMRWDP